MLIDLEDQTPVIEPSVEELIEEFKYKIQPSLKHKELVKNFEEYLANIDKFHKKKNRRAAMNARKNLRAIWFLSRQQRIEIQRQKSALGKYEW